MKRGCLLFFVLWGLVCFGEPLKTDEQLNGLTWVQTSVEYPVSTVQAFRLAELRVNEALKDKSVSAALEQPSDYEELPPAVIVDVDETVLDNSPFQAQLVESGQEFSPARWEAWVQRAQARAIPGAKAFVEFLKKRGVDLFYVTNRKLKDPTLKNIRTELDPEAAADHLLCKYERKGWGSDKSSRRTEIAKTHRILLLVGDDYNDFASLGKTNPKERVRLAQKQQDQWGVRWVLISNPLYGNWERSLYDYNFGLSRQEKINRKLEHIRPDDSKPSE